MPERRGGCSEPQLIGSSRVMCRVRTELMALADLPWPVRLEGATGTGKGVAARWLHRHSRRGSGPFEVCGLNAIPDSIAHGELFGHARGAYTGADREYAGAFERAHGGTLFLDELTAATPAVQLALLQFLDDGTIRRLGEQRSRCVDVRIVYATNADLEAAVVAGRFRRDLYYRLGELVIRMPTLAEHREDIPELVEHLQQRKAAEVGWPVPSPSPGELAQLMAYGWPGNVRELEQVLVHYAVHRRLPKRVLAAPRPPDWRERIPEVLARHGGNKTAAARDLGISRKTLYDELHRRAASDT